MAGGECGEGSDWGRGGTVLPPCSRGPPGSIWAQRPGGRWGWGWGGGGVCAGSFLIVPVFSMNRKPRHPLRVKMETEVSDLDNREKGMRKPFGGKNREFSTARHNR